LLSAVETARQHGTLSSLDFSAIYSPYSVAGRAVGGFVSNRTLPELGFDLPTDRGDDGLEEAIRLLVERLRYPIEAKVSMLGQNGLIEQTEKYNKVKSKGRIGG